MALRLGLEIYNSFIPKALYASKYNTSSVPGGSRKSLHFWNRYHSSCMNTTEMCNTGMKRKFCGLFGDIFKNCEKCSYQAVFAFFWPVAEIANKPIF